MKSFEISAFLNPIWISDYFFLILTEESFHSNQSLLSPTKIDASPSFVSEAYINANEHQGIHYHLLWVQRTFFCVLQLFWRFQDPLRVTKSNLSLFRFLLFRSSESTSFYALHRSGFGPQGTIERFFWTSFHQMKASLSFEDGRYNLQAPWPRGAFDTPALASVFLLWSISFFPKTPLRWA